MSFVAWLDYSTRDQRRVLDTIKLFSEQGTVDEIGVGTVRDALADQLFPGTSTIQTRAKYFLFVPWIYQRHEARETPSAEIAKAARKDEVALIEALAESEDKDGVIGISSRAALKRLPSAIYWQGLAVWGIRLFESSQDQYHRSVDHFYRSRRGRREHAEGEAPPPPSRNWHPAIPHPPEDLSKKSSLRLRRHEAVFLQERILANTQGTLLAFLADQAGEFEPSSFAWEHPRAEVFPRDSGELLGHARAFSELIHGAALLYNLMLAELKKDAALADGYTARLSDWAATVEARRENLRTWDRGRFWELVGRANAGIPQGARNFVNEWCTLALDGRSSSSIASNSRARQLVHERERFLKKGLARLDNRRSLDLWRGESMAGQFDFRWDIAQRILNDIFTGLRSG